jgi:hypothetical protein
MRRSAVYARRQAMILRPKYDNFFGRLNALRGIASLPSRGHRACGRKTGFCWHSNFHDWRLTSAILRITGITGITEPYNPEWARGASPDSLMPVPGEHRAGTLPVGRAQ